MTTETDYIKLLVNDIGASLYAEVIIVDQISGTTNVNENTACDRTCNDYNGYAYIRDLFEADGTKTVKSLLSIKGKKYSDYTPYYRDYNTNTLTAADYGDALTSRRSILYFHNSLSTAQISFIMAHIGSHREILPSRMVK